MIYCKFALWRDICIKNTPKGTGAACPPSPFKCPLFAGLCDLCSLTFPNRIVIYQPVRKRSYERKERFYIDTVRNASFSQGIGEIWQNRKAENTEKMEKNHKNQFQMGKMFFPLLPKTCGFTLRRSFKLSKNKTFCEKNLALSRNAGHKILDYFRFIWNIWGRKR